MLVTSVIGPGPVLQMCSVGAGGRTSLYNNVCVASFRTFITSFDDFPAKSVIVTSVYSRIYFVVDVFV